jgi:hypothetical protein
MNTELRNHARQVRRRIREHNPNLEGPIRLDTTNLWKWLQATRNGSRSFDTYGGGRVFFYSNPWESPWASRLVALSTDTRILVAGTSFEVRQLEPKEKELRITGEAHGIFNSNITYASRLATFWEGFYNCENFLGKSQKPSLPALIITTGSMRNYGDAGGETLDVEERLREIANFYKIPIVLLEPTHP